MKTYIVGHKNPDTDSIISAIALSELEKKLGDDYIPARAGEINKETNFVLKKFGFEIPEFIPKDEKEVILVDHNEPSQIHENIDISEIKAIFDHHKLGGLSLSEPILVEIKPIGSTSTIITDIFQSKKVALSAEIASLLIAGIVSDTLNLVSPTTTEKDKEAVEFLNQIARLDIDRLSDEMFVAKSDISDTTTNELITKDYKVFDMKGKKVGIGVWETVLPKSVLERKNEILSALEKKKKSDELDLVFFAVVDIIKNSSILLVINRGEKRVAEEAFKVKIEDSLGKLPGIVSRKKQIVPAIEKVLLD